MPKPELCATCRHPRHTHGADRCTTKTVSGPPSTEGKRVGDGYEHTGRTVTACTCTGYATNLNGAARV